MAALPAATRRCGELLLLVSPILALGLLATALVGCGDDSQSGAQGQAAAPPTVSVAEPVVHQVTEWDEFTGRLAAVDAVDVRARVSGYLQSIHFEEGGQVEKGDLLFVVDPRPYVAELTEAEADVTGAKVRLELARSELDRAKRLFERRAISEEEFDARTQETKEAEAALAAAEAAVEAARLDVEFTEVRAPISGRISNARVTEGNLIRGGSADATVLTTLVSVDPIYFYFTADERAVLRDTRWTAAGDRPSTRERTTHAFLQLADEEGFPHEGLVDFVDNRIDEATGTLQVRAVFDNPEALLVPGMFGKLTLPGRGPYQAVLVPDEAIGTDQSQQFLYVVKEGTQADGTSGDIAERRTVRPGIKAYGLRVIESGLEAGERVVVRGIQRVRAGRPVTSDVEVLEADPAKAPGPARALDHTARTQDHP